MSVPSMQPAPGSSSSYFHQPREKRMESNNSSFAKTVTIDRGHYEHLLRISQQFENIKRSLLAGGVSRENFNVLANDSAASLSPAQTRASSSSASTAAAAEYPFPKSGPFLSGPGFSHAVRDKEEDRENGFHASSRHENPENSNSEGVDEEEDDDDEREKSKPDTEEIEQRTLEIGNLPDRTTHLDLTNAIRGGALLEIYLRYMDNSARVTFADPAAAQQFYERARRVGFVVGSRRTEVTWSDRQFFVRPYIKQHLSHGASRNLVIHNTNPNITAKLIRDHLEHIHNLVVLDVRFDYAQAVAYIHTNSVHNAMFARSCMRSRAAYRGMRIEFAGDECAGGWYQGDHHDTNINTDTNSNTMVTIMKKTSSLERGLRQRQGVALSSSSMPTNRFEMLTVEEYESGSETETDGD